ncbi:hypothetical protein Dred_3058 [Desulforamulus reducens MI-1]|uniref:Uncharacterized protein n=1 Tax=Desulforamulus reducens (strain ATCC BAA-1160 / DSM 100696 / MI-1) TaxID=349161 RepID=A4J907_DESRM|nr:hypothetical protein Dred_3058 [Desulforamulus reducens MI-1]
MSHEPWALGFIACVSLGSVGFWWFLLWGSDPRWFALPMADPKGIPLIPKTVTISLSLLGQGNIKNFLNYYSLACNKNSFFTTLDKDGFEEQNSNEVSN